MQADILDGLKVYLDSEMTTPVYYPAMPRSVVSAIPRSKALVISPGGSMYSGGDNSYIQIARLRADIRCWGETPQQAMNVYREAAELLKGLTPIVVDTGPVGETVGVRLHNAILINGPLAITDPDTQEVIVFATWGVHGSEVEILQFVS